MVICLFGPDYCYRQTLKNKTVKPKLILSFVPTIILININFYKTYSDDCDRISRVSLSLLHFKIYGKTVKIG